MKKIFSCVISLFVLLPACTTIIRSEKRKAEPATIRIGSGVIASTGAVNLDITFLIDHVDFFPSSFIIESNGKIVYLDPVIVENPKPADFIFITHAHADHLSVPDIKKISGDSTMIICPKKAAGKLKDFHIKEVKPGDSLDLDGIRCEAVHSYNISKGFFSLTAHPKKHMNAGYILTIDGVRIYHAGDTDFIPEMKDIKNITIALVPIDGQGLTMSTEEAADFINMIKPGIAVPMHYNLGTDQTDLFRNLVHKEIDVVILD